MLKACCALQSLHDGLMSDLPETCPETQILDINRHGLEPKDI